MVHLLALALPFFANSAHAADWKKHPESIVVKVYSCFSKAPENCLEGSGVLVRVPEYGGNVEFVGVLTSEHVVIPSNQGIIHRIEDANGKSERALFYQSNWDGGVALLSTGYDTTLAKKKDLPLLSQIPDPDLKTTQSLTAFGFPAGSHSMIKSPKGQNLGVARGANVLFDWGVMETRGLSAEFGMSGGPVFTADGRLFGIMSHVNFDSDPKTFVIPTRSLVAWGSGPWAGEFYRTVDDFKRMLFSRSRGELVRLRGWEMTFEKVGPGFVVTLPPMKGQTNDFDQPDYNYEASRTQSHFGNFPIGGLESRMRSFKQEKILYDHRPDGSDLGSLTLAEFVGSYLATNPGYEVLKSGPKELQPWEDPQ